MNLLNFWKHKTEKHVIKDACLKKLPTTQHSYYEETEDEPTHYYNDGTGLLTGILVGEMLSDNSASNISSGEFIGTNSPDQFSGFGGGDFSGAGSGGSYDAPDTSSSDS